MKNDKLAFLFPGQGSQSVGMLADLADNATVQSTFAKASEVLGYDLWALIANGPAEELNQTHRTQPALLTASVALFWLWQEKNGVLPATMAGHSLGEYSALVCAGALTFEDAVGLVEKRGQFMQQAVPAGQGAMAAVIGLEDEVIAKACTEAALEQVVSPVNFNSPGQVVIAGNTEAVERAGTLLKEAGAKRVLPLPVSAPSHCALMRPAAEQLAKALEAVEIRQPDYAVINNVDVVVATQSDVIKDALVRQLHMPVRWTETITKMSSMGINEAVEMGPGKVLSGLVKRIDRRLACQSVNDLASLEKALSKE
jgi:[acyl-carrier-protein] S-malonyltransferase